MELVRDSDNFANRLGSGEGLGHLFVTVTRNQNGLDMISKILELAKDNPEFAKGLSNSIGYIFKDIPNRDIQEKLLVLAESNIDFAREFGGLWINGGLGNGFNILSPKIRERIFMLAAINDEFANGLGNGFGRSWGSWPDRQIQKWVLDQVISLGGAFAQGFGETIGDEFSHLNHSLQVIILDAATTYHEFASTLSISEFSKVADEKIRKREYLP